MYAIKRELKLNKVETSLMRGNAGFKRFVYNFGLDLLTATTRDPLVGVLRT
jgi:putative transposase